VTLPGKLEMDIFWPSSVGGDGVNHRHQDRFDLTAASTVQVLQAASYGNLRANAMAEFQERAQLLQLLNKKDLEQDLHWDVYLWMIKRHWALVFHPRLDKASDAGPKSDLHHELRVDSDYLRRGDGQGCVVQIPVNQAYVVIELLVAEWPCEEFFPYLSIFPGFDESKENVANFGTAGPCKLEYITEQAMEVMSSYRMYGLVGCNCQHFAVDVLKRLPGIKDAPSPDDQRLAEVIEKSAQAISITNGVLKGLVCAKTASTLGSSLATGGVAGGAAGTMALGVGVAVLTGHILCGCAVGAAASTGVRRGYEWVSSRHRRAEQQAADGAEPKGHVQECSECRECIPSSQGEVVGPLQPDESRKPSSNDVAESIRVEGPLGMI